MRIVAISLLSVALASCALAPTPIALSEAGTTIKYDPVLFSTDDAAAEAQTACARYGRTAKLQLVTGIGTRFASFDCVTP
jgi:hypothetical protein